MARQSQSAIERNRGQARIRSAERQRDGSDLTIPPVANPDDRARGQKDVEYFLRHYMPETFFNSFTAGQRAIIEGIVEAVRHRAWQAVAAERGGGKTSIVKGVAGVWGLAYGFVEFLVIVAATGTEAKSRLRDIKTEFQFNDRLAGDFPEICVPIRALEGATQRQRTQTVNGVPTQMEFGADHVIFPTVAGSAASGSVIQVYGAESSIRGAVVGGKRPDLAILDDIETDLSVLSPDDTKKRRNLVEKSVVGLAGPGRRIGLCYPCTIIRKDCLADEFTDRTRKPAWHGIRHKLLIQRPDREDLWEKYIETRQRSQIDGDRYGRAAHRFYLERRAEMDAGAIVNDPHRYDPTELPDGTQLQVSTLQFCYDLISDGGVTGWSAFASEYQNEPPEEEARQSATPEASEIMEKLHAVPRGIVPAEAEKLTAHIDVHGRHLDWVLVAWRRGCGLVVDYGVHQVNSPEGSLKAKANAPHVEKAIYDALCDWRDAAIENGWPMAGTGEVRIPDLVLVDAGWKDRPVYQFCLEDRRFFPARGFGSGMGQTKYRQPVKPRAGIRIGEHWFASLQGKNGWLYNVDADHFKRFAQDGFRVAVGQPGSISLFGEDPLRHRQFAGHITSEEWVTEYRQGKGYISFWNKLPRDNHWLDALAGACAAGSICGVRVLPGTGKPARKTRARAGVSYTKRFQPRGRG